MDGRLVNSYGKVEKLKEEIFFRIKSRKTHLQLKPNTANFKMNFKINRDTLSKNSKRTGSMLQLFVTLYSVCSFNFSLNGPELREICRARDRLESA
jgi:hypothetical protein